MDVVVPKVGLTIDEVEVVEWLVPVGAEVRAGQPVVLVNADKADVEVESPADGVLAAIAAHTGEVVGVGGVLGTISANGDVEPSSRSTGAGPASRSHVAVAPVRVLSAPSVPSAAPADGRRRPSSPRARAVARALAVDLGAISGSGPGGRVVERDVRAAVQAGRVRAGAATGALPATAKVTVSAARAIARQRELRARSGPVRFTDLVIAAVATTWIAQERDLRTVSLARSRVDGGGWSEIAVDEGAVVEVTRIAANRAHATARPSGGVTSPVVFVDASEDAVDEVVVPVPPGAVVAVGIGGLEQRPVSVRGQLDIRHTVTISFSADPGVVPVADLLDLAGGVVTALEQD